MGLITKTIIGVLGLSTASAGGIIIWKNKSTDQETNTRNQEESQTRTDGQAGDSHTQTAALTRQTTTGPTVPKV